MVIKVTTTTTIIIIIEVFKDLNDKDLGYEPSTWMLALRTNSRTSITGLSYLIVLSEAFPKL